VNDVKGAKDAGAEALLGTRPSSRRSDEDALAFARSFDAQAFGTLVSPRVPDFAAAGFKPTGTLFVRAEDVGRSGACLAIPYEPHEDGLAGRLSRTWREEGQVIAETYDLLLRSDAQLVGPSRKVVNADKTTSSSAFGWFGVLGEFHSSGPGRLHYDGCAVGVESVSCSSRDEVVYDRCPEGPRTCSRCTQVGVRYAAHSPRCTVARTSVPSIRRGVHECAPCEADPIGDAIPEIERELVGRVLVMKQGGLTVFATPKSSLEKDLGSERERRVVLGAELASTKQSLDETRSVLSTKSSSLDRASAKIEADKVSLDRAKDALAVALSQIEEAESRV